MSHMTYQVQLLSGMLSYNPVCKHAESTCTSLATLSHDSWSSSHAGALSRSHIAVAQNQCPGVTLSFQKRFAAADYVHHVFCTADGHVQARAVREEPDWHWCPYAWDNHNIGLATLHRVNRCNIHHFIEGSVRSNSFGYGLQLRLVKCDDTYQRVWVWRTFMDCKLNHSSHFVDVPVWFVPTQFTTININEKDGGWPRANCFNWWCSCQLSLVKCAGHDVGHTRVHSILDRHEVVMKSCSFCEALQQGYVVVVFFRLSPFGKGWELQAVRSSISTEFNFADDSGDLPDTLP